MKGNYLLTILFLFFHRPSIENGMFFTDLPSWGLHLPLPPWKRRLWVHSLSSNCSHNRLCFNSPNSDSLICQGLSGIKNPIPPLPLTHRHTPLAHSVKSKVFERLALSVIYLLIEGNSESLCLLVSWKGSTWGEISCSVIVHLLESFRMSFARKRVWNHCWLDRMMFVSAALITSWLRRGLWSFYQAVMSEMSKWKVGRLFLNLSLLWYFGRTRRFT